MACQADLDVTTAVDVAAWRKVFPNAAWGPRYALRTAVLAPPRANESTLLVVGGGGAKYFDDVWSYVEGTIVPVGLAACMLANA